MPRTTNGRKHRFELIATRVEKDYAIVVGELYAELLLEGTTDNLVGGKSVGLFRRRTLPERGIFRRNGQKAHGQREGDDEQDNLANLRVHVFMLSSDHAAERLNYAQQMTLVVNDQHGMNIVLVKNLLYDDEFCGFGYALGLTGHDVGHADVVEVLVHSLHGTSDVAVGGPYPSCRD